MAVATVIVYDLNVSGSSSSIAGNVNTNSDSEAGKVVWDVRSNPSHQGKALRVLKDVVLPDGKLLGHNNLDHPSAFGRLYFNRVRVISEVITCTERGGENRLTCGHLTVWSVPAFHGLHQVFVEREKLAGIEVEAHSSLEAHRVQRDIERILHATQLECERVRLPLSN